MGYKQIRRGCMIAFLIVVLITVALYWIGGEQFNYRDAKIDMVTPSTVIGEILDGQVVSQQLKVDGDLLTGIAVVSARYQEKIEGAIQLSFRDGDEVLLTQNIPFEQLPNNTTAYIQLEHPVPIPEDGILLLEITSKGAVTGNAVTLYGGNSISTARTEVAVGLTEDEKVHIDGVPLELQLSTEVYTRTNLLFGTYYWYGATVLWLFIFGYFCYVLHQSKLGRKTAVVMLVEEVSHYHFLLKQLISRDFKTRYKRSILGVLWSFLNPLLTMMVQYLVFSTLFKSNIENFALYLLVGITCFSFFSEATGTSLTSIVGNASLITKVYMPKYIYPLSRVISALINFGFSLIPLFAVLLLTGTHITKALLLLPLCVICLFVLTLGIGMMLSALMVFFRDMQFLWGVISMLWMYATPIFYPESILPAQWLPVFKLNPLYHVIRFMRSLFLDGVSPEPKAYLFMLIACIVPFAIGAAVFRKTEDQFVLHI